MLRGAQFPPPPSSRHQQVANRLSYSEKVDERENESHVIYIPFHSTPEDSITRLMLSMLCFPDEEKGQDKCIQQLNIFLREQKKMWGERKPLIF